MPRISSLGLALGLGLLLLACTVEPGASSLARTRQALADTVGGKLEAVSCNSVLGWAEDASAPEQPIAVELAFDAPIGEKPDGAFEAGIYRFDLCQSLGSCAHAFDVAPPYSLYDGEAHGVFAYGDDVAGTGRKALDGSGTLLQCDAPVVTGSKRLLAGTASLSAWRLDFFWNAVSLEDGVIDAMAEGPAWSETPLLVRADDGSPNLWLVDGSFKRAVSDPLVIAHWRFEPGSIETRPASEIAALQDGPPLRDRPMIVQSSLDQLFLIDEELPLVASDPVSPEPATNPQPIGTISDDREPKHATCAARVARAEPIWNGVSVGWFALALAFLSRNRNARK